MSLLEGLTGRLACMRGQHTRSAKHAVRSGDGDHYESICVYCKKPMKRLAKRKWVIAEKR